MRLGRIRGGPGESQVLRLLEILERVLRETGAELAEDLAEATAPATRAQGKAAAAGDIASLFAGPDRVFSMLRQESRGKAAAWIQALEQSAGEARLRSILKGTRLQGIEILDAPDAALHRAFLEAGHKRRDRPAALVRDRVAFQRFIQAQQARVGSARKGWRDAGQDLGGNGGGWIAGGARLGRGRVIRSRRRVRVELENRVEYVETLLPAGRRRALVAAARARALERLARSVSFS